MHAKKPLAVLQRGVAQRIYFLNARIGHRVAADAHAIAVDHQCAAGALARAVIGVGIAEVEGQMKPTARIHSRARHKIKPFWRLPIALLQLGAQLTRKFTNGPRLEKFKLFPIIHPELELFLFLKNTNEHRRTPAQAFHTEGRFQRWAHSL